ncbi:MAG: amidohydrolase [Deltaproteobacteria bacterium]|nr:amidohydrolase [Deltaproteobacteria bacterium]MBW2385282.1 amidohydrolase [Deltaproteobacteria bacterium]MBW2695932.1 amidohydrolase [Deltaproteobacteria bacterium]
MTKVLIISSDCHAGALPATYNEYMPKRLHAASDAWWLAFAKDMLARTGTFFDQEAVEEYTDQAGGEAGRINAMSAAPPELDDDALWTLFSDEQSAFAPRRGEWDGAVRLQELEADGIAGEIIFPQMAPFGAGLLQYRHAVDRDQNLEGIRAYNRWLADLCNANSGRHAGVALINVDDIDVSCQEVRDARERGLWGGVLLPTSTGDHPFYHHPRYEPLWSVCAELGMALHSHSGWAPDYGDVPSATAMYISEVDMWAHRPFAALMWSGAFERYPDLQLVLTETGCSWILEALRVLEFKADLPFFNHFTRDLTLRPTEYFQRQCYLGASFLPPHEGRDRHRIGVDKLMWGSDYPHLEGTWPNSMESLRRTFGSYPGDEIRRMLGGNAAEVYGFDLEALVPIVEKVGPALSEIVADA